jgi:ferritin
MVKKHPLSSAFHDYHLYEGYAATLKKKGLTKEAKHFKAMAAAEMGVIQKIEKQRGIKAYTYGGGNS